MSRPKMRMRRFHNIFVACMMVGWMAVDTAHAQLAEQVPEVLEEVGVTEHLDAKLPLDLEFRDEDGNWVELGTFFDGERPVILTLNYYRCPMLCGLMLNGVVDGDIYLVGGGDADGPLPAHGSLVAAIQGPRRIGRDRLQH